MKLMSIEGLQMIEQQIKDIWKELSNKNKMLGINFLVEQRRQEFFSHFEEEIKQRNDLLEEEEVNFKYCKAIVDKKLPKSQINHPTSKLWDA